MLFYLYRYSADKLASPTGLDYYITQHVKFVDPSYLLNPYVTLYSINSTHAIFVETAGVDVYDVEHGGVFSRVSQYEHAYYVISLPLWAFIAFGKELGHPKADMVMVCYTARCGSSLMLQVGYYNIRLFGQSYISYGFSYYHLGNVISRIGSLNAIRAMF